MVFYPPAWVPELPYVPDDVPICDFMFDEKHGRAPVNSSKHPFTCGLSGRTYSASKVAERVDFLARALAKEFNWNPNQGSEWDKVAAIYSLNSVGGFKPNLTWVSIQWTILLNML